MKTAKEAKELVEALTSEKNKEWIAKISAAVDLAISKQSMSITLDGYIPMPVMTYLRDLGFKVDQGSQYNDSFTSISWK